MALPPILWLLPSNFGINTNKLILLYIIYSQHKDINTTSSTGMIDNMFATALNWILLEDCERASCFGSWYETLLAVSLKIRCGWHTAHNIESHSPQ